MTVLTSGAVFNSRYDLRRLVLVRSNGRPVTELDFGAPVLDALGAYKMIPGGQSHVVIPSREAQTIADWSARWSADLSAEMITSTKMRCVRFYLHARGGVGVRHAAWGVSYLAGCSACVWSMRNGCAAPLYLKPLTRTVALSLAELCVCMSNVEGAGWDRPSFICSS